MRNYVSHNLCVCYYSVTDSDISILKFGCYGCAVVFVLFQPSLDFYESFSIALMPRADTILHCILFERKSLLIVLFIYLFLQKKL